MDDTHNIVRCDFIMAQEIGAAVIGLVCGNSKGCSTTGPITGAPVRNRRNKLEPRLHDVFCL